MPWTDLVVSREKKQRAPREPKAPKLTIYKEGIAKVTPSVLAHIDSATIHILHNTDNPRLIAVSATGQFPHKLGKQGTFSAASLWRLAGKPVEPLHVVLEIDTETGYLVGDLDAALAAAQAKRDAAATVSSLDSGNSPTVATGSAGHNAATLAASEGESAPVTVGGEVDPAAVSDTPVLSGPSASGPSDTSDPYAEDEEDDDEEYEEEEEEDVATEAGKVAAQY
jgi:hypothetical protein